MSCIVVNETGRKIHITVDKAEQFALPLRYNMVISKDALDGKRHLERMPIPPKERRQIFSLVSPFFVSIENRLPSSFWKDDNNRRTNVLTIFVYDKH